MATGTEILSSKEWQSASQADREKIFARKVAKDKDYANQPADVQKLIYERFFPSTEEEPVAAEATDEEPEGLTSYPAIEEMPASVESAETKPTAAPFRKDTAVMAGAAAGASIPTLLQKYFAAPDKLQRDLYEKAIKNVLAESGIDVTGFKGSDLIAEARRFVSQQPLGAEEKLAGLKTQVEGLRAVQPPVSTGFPSPLDQPAEPTLRASGPKKEGASAVENYMRAMAGAQHQVPDVIAARATDMTKTSPTGATKLLQDDVAAQKKIAGMGGGDYRLVGQGPGQLMLPPEAGAQKMTREAQVAREALAVILPQISALESQIARMQASGQDVSNLISQLEELRRAEGSARQMTRGINIPPQARLGPLEELGTKARPTTKTGLSASVLGHLLAGGSAAYNIADAMEEEDPIAKALAYTAAGFDVASMVPPVGIGAPIKGLGIVGGLTMPLVQYGYGKYLKKPKKSVMEKK